jgi:hypothetical protein
MNHDESSHASGSVGFNVGDRLAIHNVVSTAFLDLDSFNIDGWCAAFTDDAHFTSIDVDDPIEMDRPAFEKNFRERFRRFAQNHDQRRHVMTNISVISQTAEHAHLKGNGVLITTNRRLPPQVVTTLHVEGWLVKQRGEWKIERWIVCNDTKMNTKAEVDTY